MLCKIDSLGLISDSCKYTGPWLCEELGDKLRTNPTGGAEDDINCETYILNDLRSQLINQYYIRSGGCMAHYLVKHGIPKYTAVLYL